MFVWKRNDSERNYSRQKGPPGTTRQTGPALTGPTAVNQRKAQRHHKLIDLTISKYCDLVRSKIEVEVMKSNPTIDDFPLHLSRMMERWNEKNKKLMIFFLKEQR